MNASPFSKRLRSFAWSFSVLGATGTVLATTLLFALFFAQSQQVSHEPAAAIQPVAFMQDGGELEEPSTTPAAEPAAEPAPEPATIAAPSYVAREVASSDAGFAPLGDLDDLTQRIAIEFSPLGAGIETLKLPDDFETVKGLKHMTLQAKYQQEGSTAFSVPFAALSIVIEGEVIDLTGWAFPVWTETAPGSFEAYIDDVDGNPVARITRVFTLKPNAEHGFYLEESVENLGDQRLATRLISTGVIDMAKAKSSYGGDRRRIRYGYLLSPEKQGQSARVTVDQELKSRNKVLGKKIETQYGKAYAKTMTVWPNEDLLEGGQRLSWLGLSDRYFVVAMHSKFDPLTQNPDDKLLTGFSSIERVVMDSYANAPDTVFTLIMHGQEQQIDPGASSSNTLGVYAGPRNRPMMLAEPEIASLSMPSMVVSNLGGICAPCTFSWLTDILIGVLRTFHSIVGDWAISILLLVVVVRGCLHPVTRWSQIRVQRFSVQMQAMAPKQKAIREKYKNDSKKQQAEMSKLWREEGISPAGLLGCLPMFLQSPVWIALYATLYFATELRHEPAFYGVFQNVANWGFMSDLSAPDGAIPLPASMHFSFAMWGSVDSINILPLFLGVVFFLHQKYLTPPTQATMTPEQESQQKMMKVMMVFMFPVMMYAAPSGLALYFITNSGMGIIENKWIRSHMKKHGMLEIENIRAAKKDKGPGFLQRMTEAAEAQKQLREKGPAQPNPASKQSRRGPK